MVAHKSRLGGVRLGIGDDAALEEALDALDAAGARRYLIEEMAPPGLDLILGARRDPCFGPVVVLGMGGDAAEALDTVAVRPAPVSHSVAAGMLDELPLAESLVAGPAERAALAGLVTCVAALIDAVPSLGELEINPLRATPDGGLVALDVVVSGLAEPDGDAVTQAEPAMTSTGGS